MRPAIFILGDSALALALRIKSSVGGEIHAPASVTDGDVSFIKATVALQDLFRSRRGIIGLCASGILIRALAPLLNDKHTEPPVIAVAEDGSAVVPLLGGHHGANALARQLADFLGVKASITTASELRLGFALDEPPEGFVLGNPEHAKKVAASMLARGGDPETWIMRTEYNTEAADRLVYHPKLLAVGVGCERGADPAELRDLISRALVSVNLSPHAVACHASIDLKEDEPAVVALGDVRFFSAVELNAEAHRLHTPSAIVLAETGTPGVAEAAAIAAAGPDAELIVAKMKSRRATCAIARAPRPILSPAGRPRGVLSVVGLGPGDATMRSPEATLALDTASDWVGYGLYLDLARDRHHGQVLHEFPLGGEEDRVRHALALAKEGKNVALVCSGDAGIYAMASLVHEVIEFEPCRIAIDVIPGISAFQAASARAGALIGHDFCCISLSDLLTPWDIIEKRIKAAAESDFVIAFYNPRSLKRRDQLERAVAILKEHRPAETPVVTATNLGRGDETSEVVRLDRFDPHTVDMLTVVLVGSSQSRMFTRGDGSVHAYTPRGYAGKRRTP